MKQSEIKDLKTTELQDTLVQLKKNYSDLKMTHAISPLDNPLEIKKLRKTVARVATELTKRELQ